MTSRGKKLPLISNPAIEEMITKSISSTHNAMPLSNPYPMISNVELEDEIML